MDPNVQLLDACKTGNVGKAARALKKGAHPNAAADEFGWTPLMSAARLGNVELLNLLIEAGADVGARSELGATPLGVADCRSAEVLDALVAAGVDIKRASLNNIARAGNIELLRRVLAAGVPADPPATTKTSALITAAESGRLEVARLLVEKHGANVNFAYSNQTPLSAASHGGHTEIVRLLLQAGAKPDVRSVSSLHAAAARADPELVGLLLDAGADVNAIGYPKWTPLIAAQHARDVSGSAAVMRMLLDAGADPNHVAEERMSALHFAARRMQIDITRLLVAGGADLAARNDENLTPLEIALSGEGQDSDGRSAVRRPTKIAHDDYYEISTVLIECERELGLLTSERCKKLAELAESNRCPELVVELRKSANG